MTHFELLKYAATGIASPGMTAYDKMRAVAMAGGAVKTLTGVPPLSFRANGKPLISWSMKGNGQQDGTPAPDAPIIPEFVGEKTGNLFDYQTMAGTLKGYYLDSNGNLQESAIAAVTDYIPCSGGKFSLAKVGGIAPSICLYDNNKHFLYGQAYNTASGSDKQTIVVDSSVNASYIRFTYFYAEAPQDNLSTIMLNTGSTPLPYEPYGWKIPVTSAGQTQNVYLGEVQTTRKIKKLVLDGTQNVYSCVRTTDSQNYCCAFRFSDIGMTDIKAYNVSMASIDYPIFLSDRFVNKDSSKRTYYQNISAGEMCANSLDGMNRYIIFCVSGLTTAEEYIDWFTNNPTTLYYILATPTTAIVNEPLCKIGDYADELHSEDAGVSIQTAKGANTLTVDTDLKPSSMTITYR